MASKPRFTVRLPRYFADVLWQAAEVLGSTPGEIARDGVCEHLRGLLRDPTLGPLLVDARAGDAEAPRDAHAVTIHPAAEPLYQKDELRLAAKGQPTLAAEPRAPRRRGSSS